MRAIQRPISFVIKSTNFLTTKNKLTQRSNRSGIKKPSFQILLLLIGIIYSNFLFGQAIPNEAEWNGGGYSLKKIVSNTTIASGVNFSYTILFTAPAGATTVEIKDLLPTSVVYVSVPTPAAVNGVTPTVTVTGMPGVNEEVTYSLTGLPSTSAASGSFTIVVKFPEGTTCDGASARNRARIITDDWHYTPFVSTTATAADPWKVSKSILSGPVVNPSGGSCGYLIEPDDTVTYRLSVLKNSPYYGNVVGQQNMSSAVVTDILPAGAIMLSSTCGIPANSTGTITWSPNSGNLNAATPYAYYYCDITVYYPAASFPVGSFIYNQVDLDGMMCGQSVAHTSNQTCIEVANIVANPSGYFNKSIYLTNRVPGCTGFYAITFCNNGNVPLSAFNINDAIPSGITVDQIKVFGGNTTTTMAVTANSGANNISSSINSNYFDSGTLGFTVNNLQWQMTGSLPVGDCIFMYVYFTVNPNPTGTVVTNCATFDGLSNSLTLPQVCVSFTVDEGSPHACVLKDVCSPKASYYPGDTVRFRLRIQNIGSADISGAVFQDVLHSNFTYLGNESYYIANTYNPPCSSGSGIPSGTTAWNVLATNHSGNNLEWALPDIPSDCQLFYVGYCGYYGTWGLPYYFIEFDVVIDSLAMPGVTPNNYTVSGGNLSGTVTSNTTNTLVVASFGQEVNKELSTDGGSNFSTSAVVSPGDTIRYRLNYRNTSNVAVSSVNLVDLLPMNDGASDWLVLNRSISRGSSAGVTYANSHSTSLVPTAAPPTQTLNYATGNNICLPAFGVSTGCTTSSWGTTADQNLRVDYGSFLLAPNVKIREDFNVVVNSNATIQDSICNDFAALSTASFLLDGTPQSVALTPIAAPPVCVDIDTAQQSGSCCDSVRIEQISDPTGVDCCVRISTTCEVKSISVTVNNGTLSSASWNCGTLPSGYLGQTNYTFAANNCAVDMTNCIKPSGNGTITVSYTIVFQNGDKCEKKIDLDCGKSECCDAVKLELSQDPDLAGLCCTRLVTNCEVDSIAVSVSNGTLSSANWNCGTTPFGYSGLSSYTFMANLCAVDLTTCVTANQSGVVTINYVIYFQNGEKCQKSIQLDCENVQKHCCDSIDVRQVVNAAGMAECCTQIKTSCEIDSVNVSLVNGTFSSNTWNCSSPIPSAAVGQSSFTFAAANCVLNMTNCINAEQTGVVGVTYNVYFSNGEKCEKSLEIDCKATPKNCCDSIKVRQIQNADGSAACCSELITTCEVDSVAVSVINGTFSANSWNCNSVIPAAAIGQSAYTFISSGCVLELSNCISASQSGQVTVNYVVYFSNGEMCEKAISFDCKNESSCCALVDFKLKQKWPHFTTQVGTFTVTNADPSVPICSISMSASPGGTFTTGGLIVDGVPSAQSWNTTSIPSSGSISPAAVNSVVFSLIGINFQGIVTVCVQKCDGTECCFEFKWNKKPWIDVGIEINQQSTGKLYAVTLNPVVSTNIDGKVKFISFGMRDKEEVKNHSPEFFAVSAVPFVGETYPDYLTQPVSVSMGVNNAYFELSLPKSSGEKLGAFNLVFTKMLPKLGCTLFDEDGNIVFSGDINVVADTVKTANVETSSYGADLFDFVKLYPNPSGGKINVTFATGSTRDIEFRVINQLGQVVQFPDSEKSLPGMHTKSIDAFGLPAGLYKVVISSDGVVRSKSVVLK